VGGRSGREDEHGARRWTLVRAPAQAVPASVRRFNQRARQRRMQAAAPWLAGLLAIVLLGLVGLVVYDTSLLGVRGIAVHGNLIVSADQVRSAAAVPHGAPLASLDLRAVQRRVGALPAVRQARITRDWPSTVVVTVTERTPVAVLGRPDKQYSEIDASGVVFRTVPDRPGKLPLVALSSPGPSDPGTRAALQVLAALTDELRGLLDTLVADSPTQIRLRLRDGRQVVWGDASSSAVKAQVATVLLRRGDGAVIDVSAPSTVTVN
jgi:cell division protein FtsQ